MIKKIYECKGWSDDKTIGHNFKLYVNLIIDRNLCCTKCHTRLVVHANRKIKVRDLSALANSVIIEAEGVHGRCPTVDHITHYVHLLYISA